MRARAGAAKQPLSKRVFEGTTACPSIRFAFRVVKDQGTHAIALAEVTEWVKAQGWTILGSVESPIAGGDGNKEYLLAAARGSDVPKTPYRQVNTRCGVFVWPRSMSIPPASMIVID